MTAAQPLANFGFSIDEEETTIGANGDFKVSDLSLGRYLVSVDGFPEGIYVKDVHAGDLRLENGVLDMSSGLPGQPLTIELGADGGQISGKILGPDDAPVLARVGLLIQTPDRYMLLKETMAFNAPYSFIGVPPGKYLLLVQQDINMAALSPAEFAALFAGMMEQVEVGSGEKVTRDLKLPDAFQ